MCVRYSVLHNDANGTLTEALANIHTEEDPSLSDIFLKSMDASTKALFVVY